jgi:aminoglycoside 3-N-acetyltransferase
LEQLYTDLIDQLDLHHEDSVFLSSDINRLALYFKNQGIAFSADRFIDLLQQKLSEGTLIVPAYTDLLKNGGTFDRQKSKPTTGALSNRVFKRKDFERTSDPLHSVFVWGKRKSELLELKDKSTFGPNSIFAYLNRIKGKMIIIDVHFQNSFTFVHYIEEKKNVSFRRPYKWNMKMIDNGIQTDREVIFYTKKPGYLVDLDDLQNQLIQSGVVIQKQIFNIPVLLMDLDKVGKAVEEYLDRGGKTYAFSWKVWLKQTIKNILGKN